MFEKELEQLINKYSKENTSDTPDFILAEYLNNCLSAFAITTQKRDRWYGVDVKTKKIQESTIESKFHKHVFNRIGGGQLLVQSERLPCDDQYKCSCGLQFVLLSTREIHYKMPKTISE